MSEQTDTAAMVERVHGGIDALIVGGGNPMAMEYPLVQSALIALAALQSRIEELEWERNDLQRQQDDWREAVENDSAKVVRFATRAQKAEAERDWWKQEARSWGSEAGHAVLEEK